MEHRKSVLKQSKMADAKPQAVAVHVFPSGKKKFTLQFWLDITSSNCDTFLTGKCELEWDRLFTKKKANRNKAHLYQAENDIDLLIYKTLAL